MNVHAPPSTDSPVTWIRAELELIDGGKIELRIPAAKAASVSTYAPSEGEEPSLVLKTKDGVVRRGRLGKIFSDS